MDELSNLAFKDKITWVRNNAIFEQSHDKIVETLAKNKHHRTAAGHTFFGAKYCLVDTIQQCGAASWECNYRRQSIVAVCTPN